MSHPRTPEQLERHREEERRARRWTRYTPEQKARRNEQSKSYFRKQQMLKGSRYQKGPVPLLDRDACIYLAGLFDGEGSFMIHSNTDRTGYTKYNARIRIGMSHLETIEWVGRVLNRSVDIHAVSKNVPRNRRTVYRVSLENASAIISFTEQILPFLITKREAAQTLLAFCKSRILLHHSSDKKYSDADLTLVDRLRSINRIGVVESEVEN